MIKLMLPVCRTALFGRFLVQSHPGQATCLFLHGTPRQRSCQDSWFGATPASSLTRITFPVDYHPTRCIHQTRTASSYRLSPRESFIHVCPTSTHVFRIKRKLPAGLRKGGPLSFLSLRSLFSTPAPYMMYGLGGLIPFMSAPYYMHLIDAFSPGVAHAQLVYGACILSFLGGVSWGDHLKRSEKASLRSLYYSIVLPLIAWPAVLLYPSSGSFAIMISGITYAGLKDVRCESYPDWFKNLRFLLTTLVALSLSTTLVFSFIKEPRKASSEIEGEGNEED